MTFSECHICIDVFKLEEERIMKKKRLLSAIVAIVMVFCTLTACGNSATTTPDQPNGEENIASENKSSKGKNKDVALLELSSTGEIPYEYFRCSMYNSYDYGDYANYFKTELFPFYYNSKYGFADAQGNIVIKEKYSDVNFFSEDKAFVEENGIWKVIDTKGNELFTVPSEYSCSNVFFKNGKAIIAQKIKFDPARHPYDDNLSVLVIDENMQIKEFKKDGGKQLEAKIINTPEFSGVLTYHLLSYPDETESTNYRYEYIYTLYNTSGEKVWGVTISSKNRSSEWSNDSYKISDKLFSSLGSPYTFEHEYITPLHTFIAKDGYMNVVNENKKWGLLDLKSGNLVIDYNYDFMGGYSDKVIPVCSYGKWGYVDIKGNSVISPTFNYTGQFANGRAFVITSDNKQAVIDKKGNIISEYNISWDRDFNQVFPFSEETGISVIVQGKKESGCFGSVTIVTSTGQTLLSKTRCKTIYVSNNYIFFDGTMYEIQK